MADDTRVRVKHIKALVDWIKGKFSSFVPDLANATGVLTPEHGGTGTTSLDALVQTVMDRLGIGEELDPAIVTFYARGNQNQGTGVNLQYYSCVRDLVPNYFALDVLTARHFTFLHDEGSGSYQDTYKYDRIRIDRTGYYEIDMSPGIALTVYNTNGLGEGDASVKPAYLNVLSSEDNDVFLTFNASNEQQHYGKTVCECQSVWTTSSGIDGHQIAYLEAGNFLKVFPEVQNAFGNYKSHVITNGATVTIRQIKLRGEAWTD